MLGIPIMREGRVEGVFSLAKPEPGLFGARQVELVQTFADQAVIAIENSRLLKELRQRTDDLGESLQQQTATADVLKVISRSAFDLQPVFDAIAENAVRLCEAERAFIFRFDGNFLRAVASYNVGSEVKRFVDENPIALGQSSISARAGLERRTMHVDDVQADPEYGYAVRDVDLIRTILAVPMLNGDELVGMITIYRLEVKPFTDKQVALVETFAAQAVIAVENTRLLNELRQSLQQQTATAEVLKVISRSTFDLPAVLHALVETAAGLCNADKGTITRQKDGAFYRAESYGFSEDFMNYVRGVPVVMDRHTATGRALLEGVVVHIPDVEADPEYSFSEAQRLGDYRSLLGVPMMREGVAIGVIALTRTEARAFTEKEIELAMTFADQAAIAIENVRLFDEVQARTRELAASLQELRAAQDRLVQTEKLASLGQLTAGIAHEIKNPLNFVNNFSALSSELTDELSDVLIHERLTDKGRQEVAELTGLLKDNLDKVVEHGKRADSIVKNMLLHSREGAGERRLVDVNALVDESLNLAYHGARAEKQGFTIALERSFDPAAGEVEAFPQEITRVLLNLISNGFYAATKRQAREAGNGFEPTITAATKSLGDRVEIRIRDNGIGIPPEVRQKMFNPFFTTKPAGEGTGLGLSISHDIIVKQHAGAIEVETEPGEFTELRIILPRGGLRCA
jgi:signal transduction histidine kinase